MQELSLEQLVDILQFKTEVMSQVPVVTTLLAGVAASCALVLAGGPERSRLRGALLAVFTVSALVFVFATVLDASILPGMKRQGTLRSAGAIRGLLHLSSLVVYAILAGILLLNAGLACLGFLHSRRTGAAVAAAAGVIAAMMLACFFYLDAVMKR